MPHPAAFIRNAWWLLPLLAAPISLSAANAPLGFIECGKAPKAICQFTGSRQIAYGADGKFSYGIYAEQVPCNAESFGGADPKPSVKNKTCSYAPTQIDTSAGLPWYRGVNLASAEFGVDEGGNGKLPGSHGEDYIYPQAAEVAYFRGLGMNTIRLPFRWERLQPQLMAAFNEAELARLDEFVQSATEQNMQVVLDPHNYARWFGWVVGSASLPNEAFADLWSRLAERYKANPKVVFGLMNEPHDMPTEQWASAAQAAVMAIRATGASQLVLLPGNGSTGAFSWEKPWYGSANAEVMPGVVDPAQNMAFEVHQYLDSNNSGSFTECVSTSIGVERVSSMTRWLRQHGRQAFLGEFGGADNPTCQAAVQGMLEHLDANRDVWLGWTWWAAGPWWGNYFLSLSPKPEGQEAPQLQWLRPHLPAPAASLAPSQRDQAEAVAPTK